MQRQKIRRGPIPDVDGRKILVWPRFAHVFGHVHSVELDEQLAKFLNFGWCHALGNLRVRGLRCIWSDPQFPRQQALHQAALLLVEGAALGAEEGELLVGGVEDGGDLMLDWQRREQDV